MNTKHFLKRDYCPGLEWKGVDRVWPVVGGFMRGQFSVSTILPEVTTLKIYSSIFPVLQALPRKSGSNHRGEGSIW